MRKTGYVYDPRYMLHDTGPYHPEMAERLSAIHQGIEAGGLLPHLTVLPGQRTTMEWIEAVHEVDYIRRFEEMSLSGKKVFDFPDNQMCTDTFETALLAVGGILDAAEKIMSGELDNAFCAVRPPGHHAETNQAMGFCYFNNVAICARYLQKKWGLERVAIIDFDVHHGNGTQHIFEKDPTVLYYSIHEHPSFAYPGTGREFEVGEVAGYGFTKNSPVLPGKGDDEYKRLVERDMLPAVERFAPEMLIISSGFDAHEDDDMADMNLTTDGFSWIMQQIMALADTYTGGKLVSVLEGGYSLDRLPELACNHMKILLEMDL